WKYSTRGRLPSETDAKTTKMPIDLEIQLADRRASLVSGGLELVGGESNERTVQPSFCFTSIPDGIFACQAARLMVCRAGIVLAPADRRANGPSSRCDCACKEASCSQTSMGDAAGAEGNGVADAGTSEAPTANCTQLSAEQTRTLNRS